MAGRTILLTGLMASVFFTTSANAAILNPGDVFTGTPDGSWSYSELLTAGHGQSNTYFPTTTGEFSGAAFQGYVTYDPSQGFGWTGTGFDSMQVFTTYVLSSSDMTIPVKLGGDDGHSIFFDDAFVSGGGFGTPAFASLSLTANVPKKINLVGYNGPGNWSFGFGERDTGGTVIRGIDDIPGVQIHATGEFSAVPEPSSLVLLSLGIVGLTLAGVRRRNKTA